MRDGWVGKLFPTAMAKYAARVQYANWTQNVSDYIAFGCRCPECQTPSIVVLGFPHDHGNRVLDYVGNRRQSADKEEFSEGYGAVLLGQLPEPKKPAVSDKVPVDAGELYVEAVHDLSTGRKAAGVISKCRSILDVCLSERGFAEGTRRQRIRAMRDAQKLTADLADWAENLWDDGNPAVHEIKGDEKKARQHVDFLRLFFEVAYDIPDQVAASKGEEPASG